MNKIEDLSQYHHLLSGFFKTPESEKEYLIISTDLKELYWTPNTISSKVEIEGEKATITLNSIIPFFKSYQMKETSDAEWKDVPWIFGCDPSKT